jgi:hypothetical protein
MDSHIIFHTAKKKRRAQNLRYISGSSLSCGQPPPPLTLAITEDRNKKILTESTANVCQACSIFFSIL